MEHLAVEFHVTVKAARDALEKRQEHEMRRRLAVFVRSV